MSNNILDDNAPKQLPLTSSQTLQEEILTLYKVTIIALLFYLTLCLFLRNGILPAEIQKEGTKTSFAIAIFIHFISVAFSKALFMTMIKSRSNVIYDLISFPFNHQNYSQEVAAEITSRVSSTIMIIPITIAVPYLWQKGMTISGFPINQANLLLILIILCFSTCFGLFIYRLRQELVKAFLDNHTS